MSDPRIQDFDYNVNLLRTMLWQYDDSPAIKALVGSKDDWYAVNQTEFWEGWFRDVFDLRTANTFGMSVWARILGIPLSVILPPTPSDEDVFGFGPNNLNFENGNFGRDTEGAVVLTDAQKRIVLRLRYFQLVSRGTVPETNQFLADLFDGEGTVYVADPGDMTQYITFLFQPSSALSFVVRNFDLIPRPATVGVKLRVILRDVFGFGPNNLNFENGSFVESTPII